MCYPQLVVAKQTKLNVERMLRGITFTLFYRIDKPKALSLLLHTADISHPAKKWDLHYRWTASLLEEFFRQVRALLWTCHIFN